MSDVDVLGIEAPEFTVSDISSPVLLDEERDIRLVHFVRSPAAIVMSGYLYHSNIPRPHENWLHKNTFDPCRWHNMSEMERRFKVDTVFLHMTTAWYEQASSWCVAKWEDVQAQQPGASYQQGLSLLEASDGLRIEALRALLSDDHAAGADVTRMRYMSRQLQAADSLAHRSVMQIPMEAIVSPPDAEQGTGFDAVVGSMFRFLGLGNRGTEFKAAMAAASAHQYFSQICKV